MSSILPGLALAVAASCFFNLGVALQAYDARTVGAEHSLNVSLLRTLIVRRHWLAGTALNGVGWIFQISALLLVSLSVVQPALAVGLIPLLFVGSRLLHEPVGRREILAVAAIVGGVIAAAFTAPQRTVDVADPAATAVVLVVVGLAALAPYVAQLVRGSGSTSHSAALLATVGTGMAFAWSSFSTKLAADGLATHHEWALVLWTLATVVAGLVGLLSEMSALQSLPATRVAPIVFVVELVIPIGMAMLLVGERLSTAVLAGVPFLIALFTVSCGAVALSSSPRLAAASGTFDSSSETETADIPDRLTSESSDASANSASEAVIPPVDSSTI